MTLRILGFSLLTVTVALLPLAASAALVDAKFDDKITQLQFNGNSGDLVVRVGDTTRVKAERRAGEDDCKMSTKVEGATLKIETNVDHVRRCRIDVELWLPKQIDMDIAIGSGDVAIKEVSGALSFRSGSGDLAVSAELTEVDVKTGSGSVALSKINGNIDAMTGSGDVAASVKGFPEEGHVVIRTGSGDVALTFDTVPVKGKIDVRTGSGDVLNKVPKDARVRVEFMSGSGAVRDSLGRSEDAKLVMKVKTGSGDLVLAPR